MVNICVSIDTYSFIRFWTATMDSVSMGEESLDFVIP